MIYRSEYTGGVWVDLEQPSADEIRQVAREFSLNERIEAELLSPTPTPLVAGDDASALLVLHFPAHDDAIDGKMASQEIDFVVGREYILTVRYEVIAPLHRLKKLLETETLVEGGAHISTDVLLELLFAHLYTAVRNHASHSASRLTRVEQAMFSGRERETVRAISEVSREFLHLESSLVSQEESLARFLKVLETRDIFGPSFAERLSRILAERTQIAHLVRMQRAMAAELRETNNALLSAKQNEVIKTLTVVSFIFLPLALIAKVFAMKAEGMPFVDDSNGFWIILGIMAVIAAALTFFVTRKRWI